MNNVILCGNLTKDVELSTTNNGTSVGKLTLAVQRSFPNQDGEYEADFITIIVWNKTAENCAKYLKKGRKALIEGELHIRSYEADDGSKRYVTEVVANKVEFVGSKSTSNEDEATSPQDPSLTPINIDDDSLPF